MAGRPMWQGHLRLSLVTCPVALFSAIDGDARVRFHMVNPATMNRINIVPRDPEEGLVERSHLVKGYEVGKGKFLQLTDQDFEAIRLESTRIIDIERFVPADDIDRIYWDNPYYVVPDGRTGIEAFSVIREAMLKQNQVALGRLVIQTRERLCAMEPRDGCILLTTLRAHDEVRDPDAITRPDLPAANTGDVRSAIALVRKLHGKFDPRTFVDRYDKALRAIVKRKQKGRRVKEVAPAPQRGENVVDLAEALRRSLSEAGSDDRPAPRRPARRKAAARHPARKVAGRRRA